MHRNFRPYIFGYFGISQRKVGDLEVINFGA